MKIAFLFVLSDLTNTIQSSVFSIIAPNLVQIYDKQPITVNLATLSYLFILPIITPLANYTIDTKGMGYSVRVGVVLGIIGAWIKYWINQFFEIIIIGTIFTAIGGPFIFNSKTIVGPNWFRPKNWPQVTIFITLATMLNSIVSILIPGFWFSNYDVEIDEENLYSTGKSLVKSLIMNYAIAITAIGILVLALFHNKPDIPVSYSSTIKRESFKQSFYGLIKDKNYLFLLIGASLCFGSYTGGIVVSVAFLGKPFGYDETDTSKLITVIPLTAIIGTTIAQRILKKSKQYKRFIIINFFMQAILTMGILFIMELENFYFTLMGIGILGLFAIPVVAIVYEYACEIVFPISEGSALGYLIGFSSVMAFLFGILFSYIIKGEEKIQSYYGVFILLGIFAIGLGFIIMTDENLKRTELENKRMKKFNNIHFRTFKTYEDGYKKINVLQDRLKVKKQITDHQKNQLSIIKKLQKLQQKQQNKENNQMKDSQVKLNSQDLTQNFIDTSPNKFIQSANLSNIQMETLQTRTD